MNIIVLTTDTLSQRCLVHRLSDRFTVAGILIQEEPPRVSNFRRNLKKYKTPWAFLWQALWRSVIRRDGDGARRVELSLFTEEGRRYEFPEGAEIARVSDINGTVACDFVRRLRPDLIAVSGTQLLREPLLSLHPEFCPKGIVNMHTGLSPYVRGGGATFWALHSGHPEHVGVTIHFMDPGIDSGNIILSGRPAMEPGDTDYTLDAKVRRLGIELYVRAVGEIETGTNRSVRQWEGGQLFARKTGYVQSPWLIYRLRRRLRHGRLIERYLANKARIDRGVTTVA